MPVTIIGRAVGSGMKGVIARYTGPSSYATGGESINPATLGLSRVLAVEGAILRSSSGLFLASWDSANNKMQIYRFDYPNASQGPAVEVPAATNMSGASGIVIFWGR
jgi:hypothetical protein